MRTVQLVLIACILLASGGASAARGCKIGYIDVPRILEEYEGYKAARKDLSQARVEREEEFAKRAAELKKLGERIQEGAKLLSEAKRRQKEQDYMKKAQDLEKWRFDQNKELQEREEGLLKRLESDVRKALETIGAKGKYSFVVRGDLMLYVTPDADDLTDDVLARLRKGEKGK